MRTCLLTIYMGSVGTLIIPHINMIRLLIHSHLILPRTLRSHIILPLQRWGWDSGSSRSVHLSRSWNTVPMHLLHSPLFHFLALGWSWGFVTWEDICLSASSGLRPCVMTLWSESLCTPKIHIGILTPNVLVLRNEVIRSWEWSPLKWD